MYLFVLYLTYLQVFMVLLLSILCSFTTEKRIPELEEF